MDKGELPRILLASIGGFDKSNYRDVINAGADWVCSIYPVLGRKNMGSGVESFIYGSLKAAAKRDS